MRTSTVLSRAVAAVVRDTRKAYGWTQHELARGAGVSQSTVSRIESEQLDGLRFGAVFNLLDALSIKTEFGLRPPFVDDHRRQHDLVHARCVAYVARRLAALGWRLELEVEVGRDRPRGWIDVLAFELRARALFVGEVKTDLPDLGAAQRQVATYEREARFAAQRLGWQTERMAVAVLALATKALDDRITANRVLLREALPGRAPELDRWLLDPDSPAPARSLALIDPSSRRGRWLQASTVDGRRTAFPYLDYAEAARAGSTSSAIRKKTPTLRM